MVELLNQGKKQDGNVLGESKNGFKGKTPLEADTSKNSISDVFQKKLEQASKIKDDFSLPVAYNNIAKEMIEAGCDMKQVMPVFEKALEFTSKIEKEYYMSIVYKDIAVNMKKAGYDMKQVMHVFEKAISSAFHIENEYQETSAYAGISQGLAEVGMFEKAFKIASYINDGRKQFSAIDEIKRIKGDQSQYK